MPNPSRNDEWEELVLSCCCCCCFFFSKTFFCAVIVYFYACSFYNSQLWRQIGLDELNVSGIKYWLGWRLTVPAYISSFCLRLLSASKVMWFIRASHPLRATTLVARFLFHGESFSCKWLSSCHRFRVCFFFQVVQEIHVQFSEMSNRCNELVSQNKVCRVLPWIFSS